MKWAVVGLVIGFAGSALAQDAAQPLVLDCAGEAIRTETITDANDRDVSIDQKFGASVQVEISGDTGRIRLPGKLVPLINDGKDNWFVLSEIKMGADIISARYRVNLLRRPSVEIDRRSGKIRIEGSHEFYGHCERASTTLKF